MAVVSVAIEFLSDSQNESLQSIKTGDVIHLRHIYPVESSTEDLEDLEDDREEESEDEVDADYVNEEQDAEPESDEHEPLEATVPGDGVGNTEENDDPSSAESDASVIEQRSNGDSEDDSHVTSPTGVAIPPATVFLVDAITTDFEGHVTELELIQLNYEGEVQQNKTHSYQIYGSAVTHAGCTHSKDCGFRTTLNELHEQHDLAGYSFHINPSGDDLHKIVSGYSCPVGCSEGFLGSLARLSEVLDPNVFATSATVDHRPVCPVCMGLDLVMEHQDLRVTLEEATMVDIGACVEFTGRFNHRGSQLHYSFYQYDEREWGMLFDDMESNSEDDYRVSSDAQWQYYADAMDTQSQIPTAPASDAVINSLPLIPLATVKKVDEDDDRCLICQEDLKEDSLVTQLPCGHVYCEKECIQQWLKHQDHCPKCRKKVAAVRD